ncbi:MAG: hypothetical protein R3F62_29030 [Planctomycetota bacterium]
MSERRRINTGLYGLISVDDHGTQVVSNWPRGMVVEFDQEDGKEVVRAGGKVYRLNSRDRDRVRRASSKCR